MIINAVELRRRYLERIAGVRDKKIYIGPEVLDLNINNSCNLRCKFCVSHHAPGNPFHFDKARFFSWEKFLGIVSDAVDLNVDQIHITGSGEPSIHPLFQEMFRHLEQQPVFVRLITNGTFPFDYCSDVIKGDHVVINFSAVDRQQYHDLQGKDLFDRVVANIKRLVALRDSIKPGFHIEIAYIVNSLNINQKQEMREMASRLGVNEVYFGVMNVNAYNRDIVLSDDSPSGAEAEKKRTPPSCLHGWFYMLASPDDNTSACCRIPKMNLGDFDKWSLNKLWNSPQTMNMRILGKYGHLQKMFKACQTCPYYDINIKRMVDAVELEKNEKAIT